MRLALITLVAISTIAIATKLPAADGSSASIVTTAAEARLIDRLREMAQPPQLIEAVVPERAEVAMATTPAGAPRAEIEKLVVVPAELNVRAEPNKQGAVLGRLKQGDAVEVAGRDHGWVQVATADGTVGWASEQFMTTAN
jgi:uncharacterized protein YgiM (DUF1202 family)